MRLIDADALIDYIDSDESGYTDARKFQSYYESYIYEMPTAFDVENVIIQLENEALMAKRNLTNVYAFQKAIDIVKSALVGGKTSSTDSD